MKVKILILMMLTLSSCLVSNKLYDEQLVKNANLTERIKEDQILFDKSTSIYQYLLDSLTYKLEECQKAKQKTTTEEVFYNIYFDHNQHTIINNQNVLFQSFHDSIIKNNTISSISILGYCNELGDNDYNTKLSNKRAQYIYQNIKAVVGSYKDSSFNIIIKGLGEIANNNNKNIDNQLTKNRKVTITYTLESIIDVLPTSITNLNVGQKMTLKNILFFADLTKCMPESIPTLQRLLTDLRQNTKYHIQIRGHIFDIRNYDENGVFGVDPTLSERRAKTIYNFLVDNGIDANRLSHIGFQGKYPLHKEPKDDRRVEIKVTKIEL